MITFSIIKANTGGFVGHSGVHPDMMTEARRSVERAIAGELLMDAHAASCDDISLIMVHGYGPDSQLVHSFARDALQATTRVAQGLGLYGAGQDLLSDAFSGNLRGMGPGYAELEFEEGPSEPVICFLADKTEPGAWNYPPYKMFADPSFDAARRQANVAMDYLRPHGPFEPHRLALEDLEHMTMPTPAARLADRWGPMTTAVAKADTQETAGRDTYSKAVGSPSASSPI